MSGVVRMDRLHAAEDGEDTSSQEVRTSVTLSRRSLMAAFGLGALGAATSLAGCALPNIPLGRTPDEQELPVILDDGPGTPRMTLAMVGDVLVHEGVWMSGEVEGGGFDFTHLFAPVAPLVARADVALVNQETILGGEALGLSGYPTFNSPQELGDAEAAAGFDVALSATNHALDQGFLGISRTCTFWRDRHPEVLYTGIADTAEEAAAIPFFNHDGLRVAVLNYTESTNGILAPEREPWCVSMLEQGRIAADVGRARTAGADVVIVCPHWGVEYRTEPTAGQREWAAYFLDLGVDAVIGTHPHVLEPMELMERADGHRMVVFYSLGNFVSWQSRKETMVGGLARLTFERQDGAVRPVEVELVPVVTHLGAGTALTTYPIADYTEKLAAGNHIRRTGGCDDFSLAWCHDFCREVLGAGYDAARGVATLAL